MLARIKSPSSPTKIPRSALRGQKNKLVRMDSAYGEYELESVTPIRDQEGQDSLTNTLQPKSIRKKDRKESSSKLSSRRSAQKSETKK